MLNAIRSFAHYACGIFILIVGVNAHAQLAYGKYFGTLQIEGRAPPLAISLDAFLLQVDRPAVYPALNVIVRANLGGFNGSEYVSYNFYNPTYNYEQKILQLNDPKSDLTATLQVTQTESAVILEGPAAYRPTNTKGRLRLELAINDSLSPKSLSVGLQPQISGEYVGRCGRDKAKLQIETGVVGAANQPGNALLGFSITGRLGFMNGPLCFGNAAEKFCSLYTYSTGTYSPYTGRLVMRGPRGTIDCSASKESLQCTAQGYDKSGACTFEKQSVLASAPKNFPKAFQLNASADKMRNLPAPNPPANYELLSALNGDFYGVLHYENRDVYQLTEMSIVASTSTENEHIPNQVFVEPSLSLRLGKSWADAPAISIAYPQRVFWLNKGFAFQVGANEYILVIETWRVGYIRGVVYSKHYGRVGVVELIKGEKPQLPRDLDLISNVAGAYLGPNEKTNVPPYTRNISIDLLNRVESEGTFGVPLSARYASPGHMTNFESAILDLNTDRLSFLIKEEDSERLLTAQPAKNNLQILWPVGSVLGAPMEFYKSFTYVRDATN